MANLESDYLSVYKTFFEEFAATMNPDDQLPVKVGGYCLCETEIVGEIVDWILQYLNQKRCPSSLVATLAKTVLTEIRQVIKKQPASCGFRRDDNAYQPLKLMQVVTSKVNDVCLRYLNPECLESLSPPNVCQPISACAVKNSRRRMEDRHTIIDDFHSIFDVKDQGLTNYYAVFDGHAGTDAAVYGVSHLHQFLAESLYYPSDPEQALRDAFHRTDAMFLEKSNRENLRSGTTALCALLRYKERMLHVAWLGDSQALLVSRGVPLQLVNPHKPDRQDERERIEEMGGCVMYWGTWRVNGQLAVSRAIGDLEYKPYVTADPDIKSIPLDDNQDFLILACDGLWDYVSEQEAVVSVYQTIREHPGDLEAVSQSLVQLSKQQGSVDNISVIVVFLTDPAQLAAMDVWPTHDDTVTMDTNFETNTNNPFHLNNEQPQTNGSEPSYQKANLLLDLAGGENYKLNASSPSETDLYFLNRPANGKGDANYEDDDFGPETDVDAVDDVLLSPAIAAAKAAATAAAMSVSPGGNPDKSQLEADLEIQRQELDVLEPGREPREETPTPPADDVTCGPPLLPESENVAESGEESEDEWNYYRVEPTEKSVEPQLPSKTTEETQEEDEGSMESRLNPNAAEFVPSPTSTKPSMEELLSESPRKGGIVMDDVHMPSPIEFQEEVSLRPSELDLNPFSQSEVTGKLLPDLLNQKTELVSNEKNPYQILENESDFGELTEPINPFKSSDHLFDKSEVSSTKAEFGDETSTSFLANMSDGDYLLKAGNANNSDCLDLDASMTESDFVAANLSQEVIEGEPSKPQNVFTSTVLSDEENMCFELQKDLVPSVESEVYQMHHGNENISLGVNSTPLNQELGLGDPVLPVNVDFVLDFANPPQESVGDSLSSALHNASLSKCALSPNKETFDLVMDFTEEFVAPTLSLPIFSDDQMSSAGLSSGIQNLVLETTISNLSQTQLETGLVSPVKAEPVISEVSNFVEIESQTALPNEATQPHIVEENSLPSLLLNQDRVVHDECPKNVIDELQAEVLVLIPNVDDKQHQENAKDESSTIESAITSSVEAVMASATVATAVAVGAALSGNESAETKGVAKKLFADKGKSSAKTTPSGKSATVPQKTPGKTTPTSPTKPLIPASRSTTAPKKTAPTTTTRVTNKATTTTKVSATCKPAPSSSVTNKVIASSTSQVRVKVGSSSPTKPCPPVKLAQTKPPAPSRPRPTTAVTTKSTLPEKKPGLTNGDAKPTAKRPEPLAAKRLVPTIASKPLLRPASAPVAGKTTKTSTTSRTTTVSTAPSKPITKPAVNGITKPKTTTTTTTSTLRAKPLSAASKPGTVDKQVKDTANKHISSVSAKSSTLSRTATTTTTRKATGGVTKTTTTTTVTKSPSGPIRRPPGTTVTKTTSEIITVPPTEVEGLVVEGFTTTVAKDDSPIIDNAQIEVITSTD